MHAISRHFSLTTLALAAALAVASGDAAARERMHSGSVTGPYGRTASAQGSVVAGGGNRSAVRSVQGPNGGGLTHDVNRSYNPATGTIDRSVTTTTNSGATATRDSSISGLGTGSVSHSSSATGPYGRSVSSQGSTSVYPGGASHSGTVTGPNGGQATTQGSVTVTH